MMASRAQNSVAPSGGAGVVILGDHLVGLRMALARELRMNGVAVTVAVPPNTVVETGDESIRLVTYPFAVRRPLHTALAIKRLRQTANAEVVHAFSTTPALFGSIASWIDRSGRYIRTVNGLGRSFATAGFRGALMRAAYTASHIVLDRRVRCAVFQNNDDANWYARVPVLRRRQRRVILGSGVDTSEFDRQAVTPERLEAARAFLGTDGRPTALLVGRLLKTKGIDDLREAAERASGQTDMRLLFAVVGLPEPDPRLASTATPATFGNVEFKILPRWSDMPALYAAADVAVLPTTYREGIPRVLLESAALQLPIVTYDMPGCREIVEVAGNGVLLAPGDIDALADSLVHILTNEGERERMGKRSRELVDTTFNVRSVAAQYADLYRHVTGGWTKRRER
jgi:glycosyltransferase involved in cell wall biosynthesis